MYFSILYLISLYNTSHPTLKSICIMYIHFIYSRISTTLALHYCYILNFDFSISMFYISCLYFYNHLSKWHSGCERNTLSLLFMFPTCSTIDSKVDIDLKVLWTEMEHMRFIIMLSPTRNVLMCECSFYIKDRTGSHVAHTTSPTISEQR